MTPDMTAAEMLDRFIFIAKGSRIIDRKQTNWGRFLWLDEKYVNNMVYSVAELKRCFAHRVIKSKWSMDRRDPFGDWLKHPQRFIQPTLTDAMRFADEAARGLIQPRIDLSAQLRDFDAKVARAKSLEDWAKKNSAA